MAKYSLTKGPVADNVWALTKDPDATKIEITKNPGFDTVAFSKNAATQVSLENAGGGGGAVDPALAFNAPLIEDLIDTVGGATPTFTRATTATVVNNTGKVITVASGEARFKGSIRNGLNNWTATASSEGILIEEQRTNNCLYSADLSNVAWVASNITKSSDGVTLPDGSSGTAETLTASAGNGTLLQTITLASSVNTFTVYLQRKTGTGNIDITLDNGATWTTKVLTGSGIWDRVEVSGVAAANPMHAVGVRIVTNTDAIQMWGAQLETGDSSTSIIPTTGTAVPRDADILTYSYQPPALLGSMTFTYNLIATITLNTAYVIASGLGSRYAYKVANGNSLRAYDGTTANNYTAPATAGQSKYGLTWEDGGSPEVALYYNGAQAITSALDASGFDPAGSPLGIGNRGDLATDVSTGILRDIKFYTEAKSQAFMEAETT